MGKSLKFHFLYGGLKNAIFSKGVKTEKYAILGVSKMLILYGGSRKCHFLKLPLITQWLYVIEMNILLEPNINPVNAFFLLIHDRAVAACWSLNTILKKYLAPSLGWWKTKGSEPNHFFLALIVQFKVLVSGNIYIHNQWCGIFSR